MLLSHGVTDLVQVCESDYDTTLIKNAQIDVNVCLHQSSYLNTHIYIAILTHTHTHIYIYILYIYIHVYTHIYIL